MSESKLSFLEFPDYKLEIPLPFLKNSSTPNPPQLKRIFLAQCMDHALCILILAFISTCALSWLSDDFYIILEKSSYYFWISELITLSIISFSYRIFFILFNQKSPGHSLFKISVLDIHVYSFSFWMRQFLESLQMAFPLLWFFDILGRKLGLDLGVHYKNSL